jgi:AraC family transcriptional regulator
MDPSKTAMDVSECSPADPSAPFVSFSPSGIVRRKASHWRGIRAETVLATRCEPFEYRFNGPSHLLIASERAQRRDGESVVEGLPRSMLRDFTHKLTFVPAGLEFRGWQDPRVLVNVSYFYIDPNLLLVDPERGSSRIELTPRLFFDDAGLWQTALKLKALISCGSGHGTYAEALGAVLAHELVRLDSNIPAPAATVSGGLASWQQKRVVAFIEENLATDVSLAEMAELAGLSPFHFSRSFKSSFGVPPHHYHAQRRIERAKLLLADKDMSVTRVAADVGFSATSAFSGAFHRIAGETPTAYRRSLE